MKVHNDREELKNNWDQLLNDLEACRGMSLDIFKTLFLDTWKYLTVHIKHCMISCSDTALTDRLAIFSSINNYPGNIKQWEFDACGKFTEAVLRSISYMGDNEEHQRWFTDGMICVEEFIHDYTEVEISDFESAFTRLCNRYEEEVYYFGE